VIQYEFRTSSEVYIVGHSKSKGAFDNLFLLKLGGILIVHNIRLKPLRNEYHHMVSRESLASPSIA
jgi:hypothetical protein